MSVFLTVFGLPSVFFTHDYCLVFLHLLLGNKQNLTTHTEEVEIQNLEVHSVSNSDLSSIYTPGMDLLAVAVGQYLTSLSLTLLDSYTWSFLKGT